MIVTVSCDTFYRLSHVGAMRVAQYPFLFSVMLQRKNGKLFAVSCNSYFCAIELIGLQDGLDEFLFLELHKEIIDQCAFERQFNGSLNIVKNDMLQYISVGSSFGFQYPGNAGIFLRDKNILLDWPNWVSDDTLSKSKGSINFTAESLLALARSSPSGKIILPSHSDNEKPVTVQDSKSRDWLGVFVPHFSGSFAEPFRKLEEWTKP